MRFGRPERHRWPGRLGRRVRLGRLGKLGRGRRFRRSKRLRRLGRPGRIQSPGKRGRIGKLRRPGKPDRPERSGRLRRPEKPVRPVKPVKCTCFLCSSGCSEGGNDSRKWCRLNTGSNHPTTPSNAPFPWGKWLAEMVSFEHGQQPPLSGAPVPYVGRGGRGEGDGGQKWCSLNIGSRLPGHLHRCPLLARVFGVRGDPVLLSVVCALFAVWRFFFLAVVLCEGKGPHTYT